MVTEQYLDLLKKEIEDDLFGVYENFEVVIEIINNEIVVTILKNC